MGSFLSVEVNLTVTLETALHIGTGLGLGQLLDDRTVQGPHTTRGGDPLPYLPGASLKGRLRYHARQLSGALGWQEQERTAVERSLFGFASQPGGLVFADLHLDPELVAELRKAEPRQAVGATLLPYLFRSERSFVGLSPGRKVAIEGRLFRLELAEGGHTFAGSVVGYLPAETARRDLGLLLAALCDLSHLGGYKGRGLGKCRATIEAVRLDDQTQQWEELVRGLPWTS